MMKQLGLLAFLIITTATLNAQIVGGRIGFSNSDIRFDTLYIQNEAGNDTLKISIDNRSTGIHAGFFLRLPLGAFYLEAEPMISNFEYPLRIENLGEWNGGSVVKKESFTTIDLGLSAGVRLWQTLRFYGGVSGNVWTNYTSDVRAYTSAYSNDWDRIVQNYHAGVGLDIVNMTIDFSFEETLNGLGDNLSFFDESYSFNGRRQRFCIKLGVRIAGNMRND